MDPRRWAAVTSPSGSRLSSGHRCDIEVLVHEKVITTDFDQGDAAGKYHIGQQTHSIVGSVLFHRRKTAAARILKIYLSRESGINKCGASCSEISKS